MYNQFPPLNSFCNKYLSGFCFSVSGSPAWPRSMGTLGTLLHTHLGSMGSARMIFANSYSLYCCTREGWQVLPPRKPQMSNCFQSSYLENHQNSREKCPGLATLHPTTRCAGGTDKVLKTLQMSSNSLFLPRCFYFPGGIAAKQVLPCSHHGGDYVDLTQFSVTPITSA